MWKVGSYLNLSINDFPLLDIPRGRRVKPDLFSLIINSDFKDNK